MKLDAVAFSALLKFGNTYEYVTKRFAKINKREELLGISAVIVGYKDSHNQSSLFALYSPRRVSALAISSFISAFDITVAPAAQA